MDCLKIGLIIMGILATIICLGAVFCGIAMVVAAPWVVKIFGAAFALMALLCAVGLWILILVS